MRYIVADRELEFPLIECKLQKTILHVFNIGYPFFKYICNTINSNK